MIRNVVLHITGEQPMKADIESLPTAADAGLLCTNLRTMEGRKPLATEHLDSVFLVPLSVIRFVEIPRVSIDAATPSTTQRQILAGVNPGVEPGAESGVRYGVEPPVLVTPPPVSPQPGPTPAAEDSALEDREPDAELLRRIREA
jgi:hypothetical protein